MADIVAVYAAGSLSLKPSGSDHRNKLAKQTIPRVGFIISLTQKTEMLLNGSHTGYAALGLELGEVQLNFVHAMAVASVGLALLSAKPAQSADFVVTTLDWPPYTSEVLPKGGATTEVVRQAFSAIGKDVEVLVLPWKRAITRSKEDEAAVAYYPGYHCRHVDGFVESNRIGISIVGFAENVNAPVTWDSVDDIGEQKLKVGTVLGYANTDEFDEKAGTGWVRAISASDDVTNLRKLLRKRIDMAVIDRLVLSYLLATEDTLKDEASSLTFNARPLAEQDMYACFTDDEAGRALRDEFNLGLAQIDVDAIVERYFATEF